MIQKRSKVYQIEDKEFIELVKKNNSYSDILRALGLNTKGGTSSKLLKRRISDLKIDISHFQKTTEKAQSVRRIPIEDILIKDSSYMNISRLKKRLINEGLLEYRCSECNNDGIWMNKKLSLQLDHINGINNDHRLENLRFLCPNCHSLTETFAGRNIGA